MENGLSFEQALTRLKGGHKIARKNWYWRAVELVCNGQEIMISDFSRRENKPDYAISNHWSPSSEDMLASDWMVVE